MTPTARPAVGRWGTPLTGGGPTWVRVGVIVAVLVLAFVVAQTCQKSSIRLDKNQAIAKGVPSKPFWIVSLSRPGKTEGTFSALAVVRIDANTGKVETVRQQR